MWAGPIPTPPPFIYGVPLANGHFETRTIPNPHRPDVATESKAIAGAVVLLQGIDPARAKPWDLPVVRVEMKDRDIQIVQGEARRRVGFVRRGDSIGMASAEPVFHVLRARGSAFFSLAFPEANHPLDRVCAENGLIEFTSGAGYYWASAHVFVAEHPYFTVTDAAGRFTFTQVPAGEVELVVWLPNWNVAKRERDPETGLITRQSYESPIEVKHPVKVSPNQASELSITVP